MVDVGPLISDDENGWRLSVGQRWQWTRAGLLEEDVIWLEKMLAPAHDGHPVPDPCWITYVWLRR